MCLIRDDLSTIWCEVTSSIRTRSLKEESAEAVPPTTGKPVVGKLGLATTVESFHSNTNNNNISSSQGGEASSSSNDEIKELLLCLRPIRDGDEKVDESLRFIKSKDQQMHDRIAIPSATTSTNNSNSGTGDSGEAKRPVKKRPLVDQSIARQGNTASPSGESSPRLGKKKKPSEETEKSVVESLMLMSSKSTSDVDPVAEHTRATR